MRSAVRDVSVAMYYGVFCVQLQKWVFGSGALPG